MKMRKLIGLCAAAVLAVASTGVHALKVLDAAPSSLAEVMEADASVTYALETLKDDSANTVEADDGTIYYTISRPHFLSAPTQVGTTGSGDDYTVTYRMDGMVFAAVPEFTIQLNTENQGASAGRVVYGGGIGSAVVVFQIEGLVAQGSIVTMQAMVALAADSEGGAGSVTATVRNSALEPLGVDPTETHTGSEMIKALPALREVVTPATPNPTAQAVLAFRMFGTNLTAVSVGTVRLGVVGGGDGDLQTADTDKQYRLATETGDVDMLTDIIDDEDMATKNSVTFDGDFTFVEKLSLSADPTDSTTDTACATAAGAELRKPSKADATILTDETIPQLVTEFYDARSLCIEVDGKRSVPETDGPYTVTTDYTGIADAAFPPEGSTHNLSPIERDGTYFHIPYLTTHGSYNQRVVIVNRSDVAVDYEFVDFQAEAGNTASAGSMAKGSVASGQTVLQSTVVIAGVTRGSATLTVVAPPSTISAAIQQVNKSTGGVDTVYLMHGK